MYGYTAHDTGPQSNALPSTGYLRSTSPPSLPSSYKRDPAFNLTPSTCQSLRDYALLVLNTHSTAEKVSLTYRAFQAFTRHSLPITSTGSSSSTPPPAHPARPLDVQTVSPTEIVSVIKGDVEGNRLRMLHSLAHIESYAIDLSWDILVRWMDGVKRSDIIRDCQQAFLHSSTSPLHSTHSNDKDDVIHLPHAFYADWLRVATEESRHFTCWSNRLTELGSSYGAFPTHNGLWQSAEDTHHSILARLSVVHCVHEAHGLDASLRMARQLASSNDMKSQQLLLYIEKDEQTHVSAGLKWYRWLVGEVGVKEEVEVFHGLVRGYFRGKLRGPFNEEAREECGLTKEWYMPLVGEEEREKRERKEKEGEEKERERRERRQMEIRRQKEMGLKRQQEIEERRRAQS